MPPTSVDPAALRRKPLREADAQTRVFVRNAAIIDLKVRGEAYRAEIEKTLESLETYEDAQRYAEEVRQRVMAAKALKKAGE